MEAKIEVSRIILGTAQMQECYGYDQLRGQLSIRDNALKLLDHAWRRGIREIDTALDYGTAHEAISQFLIENSDKSFGITTKITDVSASHFDKLNKLFEIQNCQPISILLHNESDLSNLEAINFVEELCKRHQDLRWGVSIYTLQCAEIAIQTPNCSVIQLPLSILNQDFLHSTFLERARERGVTIVARSVFTLGLLFKPIHFFEFYPKSVKSVIQAIHDFALKHSCSISGLACRFALFSGCVDRVVVGMDSKAQLDALFTDVPYEEQSDLFNFIQEESKNWDSKLFRPELWTSHFTKTLQG